MPPLNPRPTDLSATRPAPEPPPRGSTLAIRWTGAMLLLSLAGWWLLDTTRIAPSLRYASYLPAILWTVGFLATVATRSGPKAEPPRISFPGEPLARWTMEGPRWLAFAQRKPDPTGERPTRLLVVLSVVIAAPAVWLFRFGPDEAMVLGWCAVTLASMVFTGWVVSRYDKAPPPAVTPSRVEVTLWLTGAEVGETQCRWGGEDRQVDGVHIDAVRGRIAVSGRALSNGHATPFFFEVPVPVGAEDAAQRFADDIYEACGPASDAPDRASR